MTQASTHRLSASWLEMFGLILCGLGLCTTLVSPLAYWDEQLAKDRYLEAFIKTDEMKRTLTAAKVPADQIPGLLRVHKEALASATSHVDLIVMSFFFLLGLLVASVGSTLVLWAKLRTFTKESKARVDAQIAA